MERQGTRLEGSQLRPLCIVIDAKNGTYGRIDEVIYGETGSRKRPNINILLIDDRCRHL
jgi:hypothetical protein